MKLHFRNLFPHVSRNRTQLSVKSYSVTGRRKRNEDSSLALKINNSTWLLAVADGMGGRSGGELASGAVIEALSEYFTESFLTEVKAEELKGLLEKGFLTAQTTVADYVSSRPGLKGMGTTLTVLLIHEDNYVWGNIGDSRLYLMNKGVVKLLTEDHSYIADLLRNSKHELPQNIISNYSNIVTRIIDGGMDKPDLFPSNSETRQVEEGDVFLLCSDGLIVNKSSDISQPLTEILSQKISLEKITKALVKWALDNGSDDNISVVIAKNGNYTGKPVDDDPKTIRITLKEEEK